MATRVSSLEHASDRALIDLIRVDSALGVAGLAAGLGVTATAVRQRLDRLIRSGIVEKRVAACDRRPRGRPAHVYGLTEKGRQVSGDNFRDLALVLWQEVREVRQPEVRRGLFNRIGEKLAGLYRSEVTGRTAEERLESLASLLRGHDIHCSVDVPCSVDDHSAGSAVAEGASGADDTCRAAGSAVPSERIPVEDGLPVLTSHSCPYPQLAEQDRGICATERVMLEELVGAPVKLSACRLDGDSCCRFTVHAVVEEPAAGPAESLRAGSSPEPCSEKPRGDASKPHLVPARVRSGGRGLAPKGRSSSNSAGTNSAAMHSAVTKAPMNRLEESS